MKTFEVVYYCSGGMASIGSSLHRLEVLIKSPLVDLYVELLWMSTFYLG